MERILRRGSSSAAGREPAAGDGVALKLPQNVEDTLAKVMRLLWLQRLWTAQSSPPYPSP